MSGCCAQRLSSLLIYPLMFRRPPRTTLFPSRRSSDLMAILPPRGASSPTTHAQCVTDPTTGRRDRKSTRLNSSHVAISYAVFCWKKKKKGAKQEIQKIKVEAVHDGHLIVEIHIIFEEV